MNNILEYKGYHTRVEYNSESNTLRGKIEGINDLVDFECENACDVEKEFHSAVDDYLMFCNSIGVEPDKEYKGTFNVRISPELHKKIAKKAFYNHNSLNAEVELAISNHVGEVPLESTMFTNYLRLFGAFNNYHRYASSSFEKKNQYLPENVVPISECKPQNKQIEIAKEN